MKRITILSLAIGFLSAMCIFALDATNDKVVKETLLRAPAAELPAKAAEIVKGTRIPDRGAATIMAVRAALEINPSLAPIVVAAIAKSVPEMAAIAASTAAELQPTQAASIAKAAAAAAPSRAGRIVSAVCPVAPHEYYNVATAVSQTVPGADREVLAAVSAAFPSLKGGIDSALAGRSAGPVSVSTVLGSSKPTTLPTLTPVPALAPIAGPSSLGAMAAPPSLPLSGTTTNLNPATSGTVPRGGRNYASP